MRNEPPPRPNDVTASADDRATFLNRALLARREAKESGAYVPAEKVIEKLEAMRRAFCFPYSRKGGD